MRLMTVLNNAKKTCKKIVDLGPVSLPDSDGQSILKACKNTTFSTLKRTDLNCQ